MPENTPNRGYPVPVASDAFEPRSRINALGQAVDADVESVDSAKVDKTTTVTAGAGLTGGGDLSTNRTIAANVGTTAGTLAAGDDSRIVNAVQPARTITAGTGLTGGGDLSANRTLAVDFTAVATATQGAKADSAVQPARSITAGTGLTGGGDLSADRTIAVSYGVIAGTAAQGDDARIVGAVQQSIVGNRLTRNVATGTDADGDTTGFTPNAATLASSTASPWRGSRALRVTATGAGVLVVWAASTSSTTGTIPVTPGQTYEFSFYARSDAATRGIAARINWIQSGGGASAITPAVVGSTGFLSPTHQRFSVSGVAPADAAFAGVQLVRVQDFTAGEEFDTDGWMFAAGVGGLFTEPGTPVAIDSTAYATAAQGAKADSAVQQSVVGNLLPLNVANGTEDGTTTGFGFTQCTGASTTATSRFGARALRVTATGTTVTVSATTRIPVTAGQTYTFAASVRSAAASKRVQVVAGWFNVATGGSPLSSSTGPQVTLAPTWTDTQVTAVAPAGATYVQVQISRVDNFAVGEEYDTDAWMLSHGVGGLWTPPNVPVAPIAGRVKPTDSAIVQLWNPSTGAWQDSGSSSTVALHAATHATGGTDELTPAAIGAATAAQGSLANAALAAAALARKPYNGIYVSAAGFSRTAANFAANDYAHIYPLYLHAGTLDRIGLEVTVAGSAGSVIRVGIWKDAGGYPGDLLLDAGTVDGTVVGAAEITISQAIATSGVYYVGAVSQGSPATRPTVRTLGYDSWGQRVGGVAAQLGTALQAQGHTYIGVSGALTSLTNSTNAAAIGTCPVIFVRYASVA